MRKLTILLSVIFTCFLLTFAGPALAQEDDDGYPPEIGGVGEEVDGDVAGGEGLPFTGANLTLFAFAGLVAIGTGAFIVVRARRRDSDEVPTA